MATDSALNGKVQIGPTDSIMPVAPSIVPRAPTRDELLREYVAGGRSVWMGEMARALPASIDDITADFGDDIYERMLFDPQVSSCITVFKASILETGPSITSVVTDKDDPEFDKAKEITDQAERMLSDLEQSFDDTLWDLLDSVALGNKVAEQNMQLGRSMKGDREIYLLESIKTKPRDATLFAVDAYINLIGLLARWNGAGIVTPGTLFELPGIGRGSKPTPYRIIPPRKFAISTFRPRNSDPRGTSILRSSYSPWWRKQQIIPEYLKYLSQFAGPSLIGTTPEGALSSIDPADPTVVINPQQVMLAALQELRNGAAGAFPFGSQVKEIAMQGEGAAFLKGMAQCDQQITKGVLTQELATEEGRHMARAAAQVHQDILDTLVRQGKIGAGMMIRNQIFRNWVRINWGEQYEHLSPRADFGAAEERDQPAMWQSVAALVASNFFSADQMQALDKKLGLPVRQENPALAPGEKPTPPAPKPIRVVPPAPGAPASTATMDDDDDWSGGE